MFWDLPENDLWDPETEPCEQAQFEDYTGVDSLAAFLCSVLVFVLIQTIEKYNGYKPLFSFPGLEPYEKDLEKHDETTKTAKEIDVDVKDDQSVSVGEDVDEEGAAVQSTDESVDKPGSDSPEYEA